MPLPLVMMLFLAWPSLPFLRSFGVGATPLGVLLAPLFARRFHTRDLFFFLVVALWMCIRSLRSFDVLEAVLLLMGPAIYLFSKSIFQTVKAGSSSWLNFSWGVITLCLLDAVIGYAASEGARSSTLLTYEPSHTARIFYVFSIIAMIKAKRVFALTSTAFIFWFFNASVTALIGAVLLLCLVVARSRRFTTAAVVVLVGLGVSLMMIVPDAVKLEHRSLQHLKEISRFQLEESAVGALNTVGGPRLVLSFAGFYHASLVGYGVGAGNTLGVHAAGSDFDPAEVPYIAGLGVEVNSYMSQIAYEVGWVGVALFIAWLAPSVRGRMTRVSLVVWSFAWLNLILFSTTTTPTPWVLMALANSRFVVSSGCK